MGVEQHTRDQKGTFLCQLRGNSLACIWMDGRCIHNDLVGQISCGDYLCHDGLQCFIVTSLIVLIDQKSETKSQVAVPHTETKMIVLSLTTAAMESH